MKFEGFENEPLADLPVTADDFEKFCDDIFEEHAFPKAMSYKQMIASMILHLDTTTTKAPKLYFAKAIKKAQANEVAFNVIQDCKDQEIKAQAEQAERLKTVATNGIEETAQSVSN